MRDYRFVFTKEDVSDEEVEMIIKADTDKEAIMKFFESIGGFNNFGCHVSDGRVFTSHSYADKYL
jgi:hypothetical protein|tara:strand:- start:108 stop:302 length:195 start_codon:yes stop_codon:yes gene_type:complete